MLLPWHREEEKRKRLETGVASGSGWAGEYVVWDKSMTHRSEDASRVDAVLLMGRARVGSAAGYHGWQGKFPIALQPLT